MEKQKKLLALIEQEYEEFCAIPIGEYRKVADKKSFINGLMTAARVIGVSYESLSEIVDAPPKITPTHLDEQFLVPTYIRNRVDIEL
ncbi:hypothetical protein [Enterovibrio paralichthyis]|uniref:hypothetical protein n=1 Tax=Enterovibrio paralichthyis TaxID=2853805 RepID=UPI001C48F350|nr:hypothetical protein [Enterovibrio paralichthyis]MBV7297383.1 hypothetical protein [Enterovibrio paralichthyis]